MTDLNRRQMIQRTFCGLAAGAFGTLTLDAEALPTVETPDVHDYESFLDKKGIPQVAPAGEWKPSFKDILGPFYVPGAPFRGKVTAPLAEGDPLVIRGRIWGYDTKKPVTNAVLDVWQADAHGKYDMNNPNNPPEWSDFKNRLPLPDADRVRCERRWLPFLGNERVYTVEEFSKILIIKKFSG